MFTMFNKKPNAPNTHALQTQIDLALSITDFAYARQVADFFNINGIQAEVLRPTCKFGPNLRLNMNGLTVVARTIKAPTTLDVKDIRPFFSLVEVYKANGTHTTPNPVSPTPYIITNIGFTRDAEFEANNRGLVLHFQPIASALPV